MQWDATEQLFGVRAAGAETENIRLFTLMTSDSWAVILIGGSARANQDSGSEVVLSVPTCFPFVTCPLLLRSFFAS